MTPTGPGGVHRHPTAGAGAGAVGYSGTPLARKLGIGDGASVCLVKPPSGYRELLGPVAAAVAFGSRPTKSTQIVHCFETRSASLGKLLARLRRDLREDAAIWVSWPKRASRVETDITEDVIRSIALPLGFVDIKVCAVTDVWSGLKLVVRKALRK